MSNSPSPDSSFSSAAHSAYDFHKKLNTFWLFFTFPAELPIHLSASSLPIPEFHLCGEEGKWVLFSTHSLEGTVGSAWGQRGQPQIQSCSGERKHITKNQTSLHALACWSSPSPEALSPERYSGSISEWTCYSRRTSILYRVEKFFFLVCTPFVISLKLKEFSGESKCVKT